MRRVFILTIGFIIPFIAYSQQINGKVYDEQGVPIIGAYIIHLESDHHAHTNLSGSFQINEVNLNDSLQLMHLGYETRYLVVTDLEKDLDIVLKEAIFQLDDIVVGQEVKSTNLIVDIDMKMTPIKSSQEILTKIPGLIIGQHAGGGKAEQIFLRGFDIDHGTDISVSVDGIPVNMVSHAHGQGYADLHFLIPETVESIDFGKGPYYSDKGNFATAGYVDLKTKDRPENSFFKLEQGQFNTLRTVGLWNVLQNEKQSAYIAGEYSLTDGPFESSQNFNRTNIMAKYSGQVSPQNKVAVLFSHFNSTWDASGQIPQRAIDSGLISRFGAIDDTEGGKTSRTNLAVKFNKIKNDNTFIKNSLFYSKYDFELFSNFTFFLNDPVNQDQIAQRENRQLFGWNSEYNHSFFINNVSSFLQFGAGFRHDDIDGNELSRTRNRKTTLSTVQLGDVEETNVYLYSNLEFDFGHLLIQPAARLDHFKFNYINALDSLYDNQSQQKTMFSPKLNFIYNYRRNLQFFLKSGIGFHSNDTRVVLSRDDKEILPAAYGADLGTIWKPTPKIIVTSALWYLFLEQEFVYVGDEGVVEPSGRSRRYGVDLGLRYQIADWLILNTDFNYAYSRSVDSPEGENRIPLAPVLTSSGGLNFRKGKWKSAIKYRYLGDRPATENNSITAKGYFITDFNVNYEWKSATIGIAVENLFDQEWIETQFATESRLDFEPTSTEEIHFTPGTPFFIKGQFTYNF